MNIASVAEQEEEKEKEKEKDRITVTRARIVGIRDDVDLIKANMQEIHTALLGSKITNDGGLVKRIVENEIRVEKLTLRIIEVENNQGKQGVNLSNNEKIGLGIFFALLAGLIAYLKK